MQIVGILNCTADSFSDGGKYFSAENSENKLKSLFLDGANIVDIGAQATNYNAQMLPWQEEWSHIEPLLKHGFNKQISIDTFNVETAKKAISKGVTFINDVSSGRNEQMLELISAYPNVKYIAMLSTTVPANKNIRLSSFTEVMQGLEQMIKRIINAGVKEEQLIVDPGIGFVSDAKLSFEMLNNAKQFKSFGFPVMIGHSRKSFLENMANSAPHERDAETLSISQQLQKLGVDMVRVHNVAIHRALTY